MTIPHAGLIPSGLSALSTAKVRSFLRVQNSGLDAA